MEDQHLWLGRALVRWCFDKASAALPDVCRVDRILSKLIIDNEQHPQNLKGLQAKLASEHSASSGPSAFSVSLDLAGSSKGWARATHQLEEV